MARADTFTLLPLDTYARIMGLNPLHFNGARLPQIAPEPFTVRGQNTAAGGAVLADGRPVWQQYAWKDPGNFGREDLAMIIQQAEFDIAEFLGYWPAPMWLAQENHLYPSHHRVEVITQGVDAHGQMKGFKTHYGKVIQAGRRDVSTLIGTPTLGGAVTSNISYSDPNIDDWNTLATITQSTTETDPRQIKLYYANESGAQEWEIRPLKTVTISGSVVTITLDSWLMFDLSEINNIPTGSIRAIDATPVASYLDEVEVRREFTDFTAGSAQFYWERETGIGSLMDCTCSSCNGTGCEVCSLIGQDGCLTIRNAELGLVAPVPATYDDTDTRWERDAWTECREPDAVNVWYYAGNLSEEWLRGAREPLDRALARTIAILATARIPYGEGMRNISSISAQVEHYTRDVAESGANVNTIFTPPSILGNPFGTKRGEVEAFRSLSKMRRRIMRVSATAA